MLELNKVYNMDCMDLMKQIPDNSVDSIVTDPPYGLSKEPNIVDVLTKWLDGEKYEHGSSGFMSKDWDSFVPDPAIWKECFRILKPGGHILAFGGTRTFDLISIGLRLAGFERRDTITWQFGSGFPKSLNISKAIDKMYGAEREVVGIRKHPTLKDTSKLEEAANASHGSNLWLRQWELTAPSTDLAKKYEDFGTALKPAYEPILLCRKPLEKGLTVAENVIKWGTGGINIEKCRIGSDERTYDLKGGENLNQLSRPNGNDLDDSKGIGSYGVGAKQISIGKTTVNGRFPSNLILDDSDEVRKAYEVYGERSTKRNDNPSVCDDSANTWGGTFQQNRPARGYTDNGSVTRFFYCAKADSTDRDEGLDSFLEKTSINTTGKGLGNTLPSCPEHGKGLPSGSTVYSCGCQQVFDNEQDERRKTYKNNHPTVKPTSLMKYLCRLITPVNGIVFDPFSGSGSTGKAAILEDFSFIGSELESGYTDIANARINHAMTNKMLLNDKYETIVNKVIPIEPENPFF